MRVDDPAGRPDDGGEHPDRPPEDRLASAPLDHRTSRQHPAETRSRQEYYDAIVSDHGYEVNSFASLMAMRPAIERTEWESPMSPGEVDRWGLGGIDQPAKKFSAAEPPIPEHLA